MYSTSTQVSSNINELQSDILLEDLSKNSIFKQSSMGSKNKALATKSKVVIRAINEILQEINTLSSDTKSSLETFSRAVGDISADITLLKRLADIGPNLVEVAIALDSKVKKLEEINAKKVINDFEDIFQVTTEKPVSFQLTHTPVSPVRLYIDGIRYFTNCFKYDPETNKVNWLLTSDNDGFDIEDMMVVVIYDYIEPTEGAAS